MELTRLEYCAVIGVCLLGGLSCGISQSETDLYGSGSTQTLGTTSSGQPLGGNEEAGPSADSQDWLEQALSWAQNALDELNKPDPSWEFSNTPPPPEVTDDCGCSTAGADFSSNIDSSLASDRQQFLEVGRFETDTVDADPIDRDTPDGGIPDGGIPDGGIPDGGIPDGGTADGGHDGGAQCDGGVGNDSLKNWLTELDKKIEDQYQAGLKDRSTIAGEGAIGMATLDKLFVVRISLQVRAAIDKFWQPFLDSVNKVYPDLERAVGPRGSKSLGGELGYAERLNGRALKFLLSAKGDVSAALALLDVCPSRAAVLAAAAGRKYNQAAHDASLSTKAKDRGVGAVEEGVKTLEEVITAMLRH